MAKILYFTICIFHQTEPEFGLKRLCFEKEKAPEGPKDQPKKTVNLSDVGVEPSEEESKEALGKAKTNREERKEVVADTKSELAALRASLGPLPGSPEAGKKKPEEEAKKKPDEKPKLSEEEKEKLKNGPRIPERAKDAMDGTQLMEAFRQCKNLEERQTLILDQLAKGNVPDSYRTFQKIKVERNGKTVEFLAAPSGLRLGTDKDSIEFPMNGPLAQAVADATGCELPTKWMVDRMNEEGQKNGQFIPFAPQVFSKEDAARMRSADFIKTHDDKYKQYAAEHGIDLTKPIFGYFKHVVQQSPEQRAKPHDGGNLDIYGGIFSNGKLVEPGGVGHDIYHDDYSQNVQLIAQTVYVDGKPMKLADFLEDSDLAGTFGFPVQPRENRYKMPEWMQQRVAEIKGLKPGEILLADTKPSGVFESISPDKIEKGTVTEEFDYTVAQGAPGGHVRFVKTSEGNIALMDFRGQQYQIRVDLNNASGIKAEDKDQYGASQGEIAGPFAYMMLRYFREHGNKIGDMVPFEFNGQQYLAEYQIHNDGPGGPIPYDHPGVGIMQKKTTDQYSQIPKSPGGPSLVGFQEPPKAGDAVAPRKAADEIVPPQPRGSKAKSAGGGGGMPSFGGGGFGGGGSYGGGAPSYAPTPTPTPTPVFTPSVGPTYQPPQIGGQKEKPAERKESGEYIIRGSTLFVGDSNTVGAFNRKNINVDGEIDTVAEVGISAVALLKKVQEYEATGRLDQMKNMVVTAGVNGIGMGAEKIFAALKEIWQIGKKHGLKIYAGTLAPFEGWSNFGSNFGKYNDIRKEINRMIRASQASEGIPDGIIPYDELVADPANPDRLDPKYEFSQTKPDHLHIDKGANARIVASIVGEQVKKETSPEQNPETAPGTVDQVEYKISGGVPGGVISYEANGDATMTYQGKEYKLKVDTNYQTPDLSSPPKGYKIYEGDPGLIAVMDYAMLYSMLKWNKPQGTELPFEYNGVKYMAKLAWHTDHPGADLYIQS